MSDPGPHASRRADTVGGSPTARWLLRAAGVALVALGAVGIVVPGLPTTPLVLLAAACFARSSPQLHRWVLANRVFGPLIRDWQESRSISRRAKATAIATIAAFGAVTLAVLITHSFWRIAVGLTMLGVILWLSRLPIRRDPEPAPTFD